MDSRIRQFVNGLPKAELHVHIEGTLQPDLMFSLAKKNGVDIPYGSPAAIEEAYDFSNLQDFLDLYHIGTQVLLEREDFYELTYTYLQKLHQQNVRHVEMFLDPQTHMDRGIPFATIFEGIHEALSEGLNKFGITSSMIPCFLRHLDEGRAMAAYERFLDYRDDIFAIGLASSELGHPPSKFQRVFDRARADGMITLAHAGEEGPPEYIWEALELLKVSRIDHGNRSLEDEALVAELVKRKMPLTVCPLSNLKLCVVDDLRDHPLKRMMDKGLFVSIHSDDPAYFGGNVNDNYIRTAEAIGLTIDDLHRLARNSFEASFLPRDQKDRYLKEVEAYRQSVQQAG